MNRLKTELKRTLPTDTVDGPSAVIVLILEMPNEPLLVLTKRTQTVRTHRGQVCFPGGRLHADDPNLRHTAIRECQEEIGVRPEDLEVLGRLPTVATIGNTSIIPWVATLRFPYDFLVAPDEVEKIITLPISRLVAEGLGNHQIQIEGRSLLSPGILVEGELVWGATARILFELLKYLR